MGDWYNFVERCVRMALNFIGIRNAVHVEKRKNGLRNIKFSLKKYILLKIHHLESELAEIYKISGFELKKFFNTSGRKYRELGLKDKMKDRF